MPAAPSLSQRVLAWPVLWLTVATVACLVPFVNKAFHIDDTLFLYAARQIQEDPVNFYGFTVNWYGSASFMYEVMQNPPLASYYLALASALLGWSEPALHLAFLLPAIAVVWGTYRLAERMCTRPLLAALATLLTPAFLVSSTNVMCDTLTLAFWVWAVVWWERGLRRKQMALLSLAAVAICLAALTKYIGVALIPLLLVYTMAYQWKHGNWVTGILTPSLALVIPVAVLFAYQEITEGLYGHGLLFQAVGYAASVRDPLHAFTSAFVVEVLGSLCFIGGGMSSVLFYLPLLWSRRQLLIGLAVTIVGAVALSLAFSFAPALGKQIPTLARDLANDFPFGQAKGTVPWFGIAQFAIYAAAGFSLAALTWLDLRTHRDAGSLLLALWVVGIFAFATFLNWTLNVRSILPLLPAASILLARRLDQRFGRARAGELRRLAWPLLPAGVLGLLVTWADYQMAGAVRTAAADIAAACAKHPGKPWFQGHWGFQYYMEQAGVAPVDIYQFDCKAGDLIIYPANNANVAFDQPRWPLGRQPPWPKVNPDFYDIEVVACTWLATMDHSVGAGFYAGIWGPLPFAFGNVQPARYRVMELTRIPQRKTPQ